MESGQRITFRFLLITDRLNCPGNFLEKTREAVASGIGALQLREKDLSGASCMEYALEIIRTTEHHGIPLIINDRVDVAVLSGAQGVHLPSASFPTEVVRKRLGESYLIGRSTHHIEDALKAGDSGADYVIFGPVYETPSKARFGPPVGIEKLRELCQKSTAPVFAIGGIKPSNVQHILEAGAYGFAVISAVFQHPDIAEAVREFNEKLRPFN